MSKVIDADTSSSCCASCGIAEVDDIKLKNCDECDLVRYCSDDCERDHKSEHEEACRNRAAELRDELLFKQPESTHVGDCPICMLPLPLDLKKSTFISCCGTMICNGCFHASTTRAISDSQEQRCPFCRKPFPSTKEEYEKLLMKRVDANDPQAMVSVGGDKRNNGNCSRAIEYWTKAAELGNIEAHFKLAIMYQDGEGVEQDRRKATYHLEEAAMGGHPIARCLLGKYEDDNGDIEKAVKHWIIAATQGCDKSIEVLMDAFKIGFVSKEDLAASLRAHQAAVDAMKSPQREAAEE